MREVAIKHGMQSAKDVLRPFGRVMLKLITTGNQLSPDMIQPDHFPDWGPNIQKVEGDGSLKFYCAIEEGEAIPVRLSHAVVNSPDIARTRDWYAEHLGFKLSDSLSSPHMGELMHFMRCNDWHHSLAIARGPHVSAHHVSFELRGLDDKTALAAYVGRLERQGGGGFFGDGGGFFGRPWPRSRPRRIRCSWGWP